jgi:hypothetical protein
MRGVGIFDRTVFSEMDEHSFMSYNFANVID